MDLNDLATKNKKCTIEGITYQAIQLLDQEYMLCVVQEDIEKKVPLRTFVIPRSEFK